MAAEGLELRRGMVWGTIAEGGEVEVKKRAAAEHLGEDKGGWSVEGWPLGKGRFVRNITES